MNRTWLPHAASLAVATLTLVAACHGSDLSAPDGRIAPDANRAATTEQNGSNGGPRGTSRDGPRRPAICTPRAPVVSSRTFGPSGGTLVVGGSRLIIPGGALRSTVTITATIVGDSSSFVDFQPEGLTFAKPVGLVLDGAGCKIDESATPTLLHMGTDSTVLEVIPAMYIPRWKAVAAPIEHFSGYAIAF